MAKKYEIVHDKVRIAAGDARQWLVYVDGALRAEATSEQSAKDYVAIERQKASKVVIVNPQGRPYTSEQLGVTVYPARVA